MLDPKKPIFQRGIKPAISSQLRPAAPAELPPEQLELKKLQHEDDWLYNHKGKSVRVKFTDGELLEGTVVKVRKFTFVLNTETGNVLCSKLSMKYVAEVL
ncbi:MAG TPA: hypothetical protein VNZ03_15465 [Terriglobales bacterium]|nr:hypothetical protein [Terriglobales bacterium]